MKHIFPIFLKFLSAKIHPSWMVLVFFVSIIFCSIILLIMRINYFGSATWLILALLLLVFAFFIQRRAAIIFAILSGFLVIAFRTSPDFTTQDYLISLAGKDIIVTGTIAKDPIESTSAAGKFNLDLIDAKIIDEENNTWQNLSGHFFTQVGNKDLQRSDIITVEGKMSESFGNYYASIFRPNVKEIIRPEPGDIFLKIRNEFAKKINDFIPMPEAGLGMGYLLGQKSSVDQTIQDTLRTVGLTHIIVASGTHLSTLVLFSRRLFGKISRFASTWMAMFFMLFFLGITGLSASMSRASLVTGISLAISFFGRKMHPTRLIILVAAITLIYNPFYLTDLAWLLSFSSFTGILIIAPEFIKIFYGKKKPGFLANTFIASIAAFFTCLPILLYFFGEISIVSIFVNVLILPTISFTMGLTFLTGLSSFCFPFLASIFGQLAKMLLDYQITVAIFFAEKEELLVKIDPENVLVFLLYIPLVLFVIYRIYYSYACKRHLRRDSLKIGFASCEKTGRNL